MQVSILPSIALYFCFCSNIFGSLTSVAISIVFRATCSIFFFMLVSVCWCTPSYLRFKFSFSEAKVFLAFTPELVCGQLPAASEPLLLIGSGILCFILTSSSDHFCKSCMISAGIGGWIRFFQSKQACLAFSQFKLLGELIVAIFVKVVFAFWPKCASNGVIFNTPCRVVRNFFNDFCKARCNFERGIVWINFHYPESFFECLY